MLTNSELLFLSQIQGVTNAALKSLVSYLGQSNLEFSKADSDLIELFELVKQFNPRLRFSIPSQEDIAVGWHKHDVILRDSDKNDITMIGLFDSHYPPLLKAIAKPPLLLHVKGNLLALKTPTVAVIGTREPSSHAIELGPRMVKHVVEAGLTVVSGLAFGCDMIGHNAAVEAKKPTIAVLAGGLHSVYPKENRPLAERILEEKGMLISELPFGQNPERNTFVDRDRIQSGLSHAVIVLETGVKGGTLHTVKFAIEQGRPVGCMFSQQEAGLGEHEKFQGNKVLVAAGKAVKLEKKEQLLEFIRDVQAIGQANELFTINVENPDILTT